MLVVLTIPQITFGMLSGVYVDRLDRKHLMMASDLLRGLMVLQDGPEALMRAGDDIPGAPRTTRRQMRRRRGI